ncbi:MAG: protein kinase domain-containing protein [Actinomycetota bacterium]
MSYCFHPSCQNPQNPAGAEVCHNCGSQLLLVPSGGTPEAARYRALKPLGQGGFGRTFLAVDENQPSSGSHCVIKQFFPQSANPHKAAELFHQEAAQLETLGKHPQIPALLAHFEENGQQYLVQEFIDGKNLAQELSQKGAFKESQIRQLLNDLLPVLHFVHKSKVIHRDIKPENIIRRTYLSQPLSFNGDLEGMEKATGFIPFFASDLGRGFSVASSQEWQKRGQLVLVDFGAAKKVTNPGLPQTGTIIGSAAYTAPEQLMGKAIFASDIYSLGVTCIHLLTQVPPFDLFDSREGTWAWRDYLKAPVSDELGRILDTMLQAATNRRYHGAAAVIRHLNPQPIYANTSPTTPGVERSSSGAAGAPMATPETPAVIPSPPPSAIVPVQYNQQEKVQEALQEVLADYQVKIQVKEGKQRLTIVINREEGTVIYYPKLSQLITAKLTELQLKRITIVKLLGRVNNARVPEWQQVLRIDPKIQIRNKIVRLQNSGLMRQASQVKTRSFWLAKMRTKDFWVDLLMFAVLWFIFGTKIVIFHPGFSLLISSGFIGVKTIVAKNQEFDLNKLFFTVATLFMMVGLFNLNTLMTGAFGILLACLVVALPLFYVKEQVGED